MNSYIIKVRKSEKPIKGRDKIGGYPTYRPDIIPQAGPAKGHFLMELYNKDIDDSDIICWQLYQGEFGGPISDVIEIHNGASEYREEDMLIQKRRWIDEYEVVFELLEEERMGQEGISILGGNPEESILKDCEEEGIQYIGVIYIDLCPYNDLNFGYESVIIGKNKEGKLVVI